MGKSSITLQQIDNDHGIIQATPHPEEAFCMDRRQKLIEAKIDKVYYDWVSHIWMSELIRVLKKDHKTNTLMSLMYCNNYYCNENQQKSWLMLSL